MDFLAIYTAIIVTIVTGAGAILFKKVQKAWHKHLNRIDIIEWKGSSTNAGVEAALEGEQKKKYLDTRDYIYDYYVEKDEKLNKDR